MASRFLLLYIQLLVSKNHFAKIIIFKMFASQMAEFKKTQPLALARALVVALKKCGEQEKLIKMLTQNTSQEELINLPKACYCCREHDRPCLRNISTRKTPIYKQGFWESSQSSSTLPPIAPKEVNPHLMGIPARANNVPDLDLSDWNITCTEFHPRKLKYKCYNCDKPGYFAR